MIEEPAEGAAGGAIVLCVDPPGDGRVADAEHINKAHFYPI